MSKKRRANNEGSIYQRANGSWEARISLTTGKRKSFYGRTQSEVIDKLRNAQRALSDGLPLSPQKLPLRRYLATWLEESIKPELKPNTYLSYAQNVRLHIVPELGHIHIFKLTPQDIRRFMSQKLECGLSTRTVQYLHAILRRALRDAERDGLVSRNVARLVSPPRVTKKKITPLTPSESRKLLAMVENDRLAALYTVALAVGLRQGEALGLRWRDVDLNEGTLTVAATLNRFDGEFTLTQPKTEKSNRTIKLPDICIDALRAHQDRQSFERSVIGEAWQNVWGLVFTEADGSPLSRYAITRRFQRTLEKAGIEQHRFHDLRHTCATLLLAQGVPLRIVQEILGHSLLSTTADVYSHVLPSLLSEAADKMDTVLAGS